jgi:hypothetical protein
MSISPHHRHDVTANANINVTRALWIKIKPDQVCTSFHRGKRIFDSFDSTDFYFGHNFSFNPAGV